MPKFVTKESKVKLKKFVQFVKNYFSSNKKFPTIPETQKFFPQFPSRTNVAEYLAEAKRRAKNSIHRKVHKPKKTKRRGMAVTGTCLNSMLGIMEDFYSKHHKFPQQKEIKTKLKGWPDGSLYFYYSRAKDIIENRYQKAQKHKDSFVSSSISVDQILISCQNRLAEIDNLLSGMENLLNEKTKLEKIRQTLSESKEYEH